MRHTVTFVKSAADTGGFVNDGLPKLILTGRSNVGKSSLINRIAGVKGLARVSATPGKTAYVNYYKVDGTRWWVDLPGYGYADVSQRERERWGVLMESFFAQLDGTYTGALIVDIRHKPTVNDVEMAGCYRSLGVPFFVVANKADKLKAAQVEAHLEVVRGALELEDGTPLIPVSAAKGTGLRELETLVMRGLAEDME